MDELAGILERMDIDAMRAFDARYCSHLPGQTDEELETSMHMARTAMPSVAFTQRAYSHAWLTERGLPSQLPDELRPRAHRIYPVIVHAVGIAVNTHTKTEEEKAALLQIRHAMELAVLEAEADRRLTDSGYVKDRIMEARRNAIDKIYG